MTVELETDTALHLTTQPLQVNPGMSILHIFIEHLVTLYSIHYDGMKTSYSKYFIYIFQVFLCPTVLKEKKKEKERKRGYD